jgi:hypothetical protein
MKRLKLSTISHAAICSDLGFDIGAVKRDWLLILALQTTFNVFSFVVLVRVTKLLPDTAAMMIIIVKNTRKSFTKTF